MRIPSHWPSKAVRSRRLDRIFAAGTADQLPARGKLGSDLKKLIESGRLTFVTGFATESIERRPDGLIVSGQSIDGALALEPVDRVIVATGHPDRVSRHEARRSAAVRTVRPAAVGDVSLDDELCADAASAVTRPIGVCAAPGPEWRCWPFASGFLAQFRAERRLQDPSAKSRT